MHAPQGRNPTATGASQEPRARCQDVAYPAPAAAASLAEKAPRGLRLKRETTGAAAVDAAPGG
jgi:hypothetical protein